MVDASFAISRLGNDEGSEEEDCADHASPDGSGDVITCAIPDRLTLRPLSLPVSRRVGGGGTPPTERQIFHLPNEEAIRRMVPVKKRERNPWNQSKGKSKIEPLSSLARPASSSENDSDESMEQYVQVLTREVTPEELEAERRALDQEMHDLIGRQAEENARGGILVPVEDRGNTRRARSQ